VARSIQFLPPAWEDYLYWHEQDKKTLKRINALLTEIARTPFTGTGKPEPLLGNLGNWWSRRIDLTHRLVYRANDNEVVVLACRYHYTA